ncbi:hypothetical protein ACIJEF_001594 [Enterococcus faecalis]
MLVRKINEKNQLAVVKEQIIDSLECTLSSNSTDHYEYSIEVDSKGITFIPFFPSNLKIDEQLYDKIYSILSLAVFPLYTMQKSLTMQLIDTNSNNFKTSRAFFFPWREGISKRLELPMDELKKYF